MMGVLLVDGCTTSGIVSVCTKKSTPVGGGKDSLSSLNYLDIITSLFFHGVITCCTVALLNLQLRLFDSTNSFELQSFQSILQRNQAGNTT